MNGENKMNIQELETIKQQAEALSITISISNYDVNRYSVTIGTHVYTDLHKALSALTTVFLKQK